MANPIARHKTAISRVSLSRPIGAILADGLLAPQKTLLDYGCGLGDDIRLLKARRFKVRGWDPVHRPRGNRSPADIVNLGYVVNVIEDPDERGSALHAAWNLAGELLVVSARLKAESRACVGGDFGDGIVTRRNTFQKFYDQSELRDWIALALEVQPVAAAPGVFYVFRDSAARESYVASRYRRRTARPKLRRSDVLFREHKDLLELLMQFVEERGRIPEPGEVDELHEIPGRLGSLRKAFGILKRVFGDEHWHGVCAERRSDLLVYISLSKLQGRPRMSDLPAEVQLDIRAHFSSYKNACKEADDLLFSAGEMERITAACASSAVGKVTPSALYIHESAVSSLSPLLRVYEGCSRTYVGSIESANIIKLHRLKPQVSYLSYPEFEREAHPAIATALVVRLSTLEVKLRDYTDSTNPFILHRKECFLTSDHPLREKFARLTRQEESWGLLTETDKIGTSRGWADALALAGAELKGHRLVRSRPR